MNAGTVIKEEPRKTRVQGVTSPVLFKEAFSAIETLFLSAHHEARRGREQSRIARDRLYRLESACLKTLRTLTPLPLPPDALDSVMELKRVMEEGHG